MRKNHEAAHLSGNSFYVILPNGEHTKIIINIEAQKDNTPGYDLVTRAVFYCARMLSAQLGTEFTNRTGDTTKYDGIKKVYSIWICMDSNKNAKDSIVEYHMQPNIHYGTPTHTCRYDLLSAVMINLGGDDLVSENRLVNMLTTLLSSSIDIEQKKKKLQEDFDIPMSLEFKQEVEYMCNLSGYVEEKARTEGKAEGRAEGELNIIILYNWLKDNKRDAEAESIMKPENDGKRSIVHTLTTRATVLNPVALVVFFYNCLEVCQTMVRDLLKNYDLYHPCV